MKSEVADELASVITPGTSGIVALVAITAVDAVTATIPQAKVVKSAPVDADDRRRGHAGRQGGRRRVRGLIGNRRRGSRRGARRTPGLRVFLSTPGMTSRS